MENMNISIYFLTFNYNCAIDNTQLLLSTAFSIQTTTTVANIQTV